MVPGEGGGAGDADRYRVMQTDTEAVVKIELNETCLQHGDPKVTKHLLKKSKWNLMAKDAWKTNGAWRQDLLHLIK
jgi:hypothetical protein